jgi:hypothetical protein
LWIEFVCGASEAAKSETHDVLVLDYLKQHRELVVAEPCRWDEQDMSMV